MIPEVHPDVVASMTPTERRAWLERGELTVRGQELRAAMAIWLEKYAWRWFVTLTARSLESLDAGRCDFARWRNDVNRKAWGSNYTKRPHQGIWGVAMWEPQGRGDWHLHALVSGTNGLDPSVAQRLWDRAVTVTNPVTGERMRLVTRLGQVRDFIPGGGAVKYCVKPTGGDPRTPESSYDIFGPWPTGGHTRDVR